MLGKKAVCPGLYGFIETGAEEAERERTKSQIKQVERNHPPVFGSQDLVEKIVAERVEMNYNKMQCEI